MKVHTKFYEKKNRIFRMRENNLNIIVKYRRLSTLKIEFDGKYKTSEENRLLRFFFLTSI